MLDAMKHFVRVVDSGSFSSAATQAGMTPSTITRKIDQLEHELRTTLFVRSTRRLELTPHGQQFYSQCQQILASVETAKASFREPTEDVTGSVSITVFDSFGRESLLPLIPEFKQRHPNCAINLILEDNVIDLHQSPYDIGIRYGQPTDSSLLYRSLIKTSGVLVSSPDYLANHPAIQTPEDLRQHQCLTFFRPRQYTYWHFRKGSQYQRVRINGSLSSRGGSPLISWCRQGLGIALITREFITGILAAGELLEVLPDWKAALTEQDNNRVYLVWTQAASHKPATRAMVDFLVEKFGDTVS